MIQNKSILFTPIQIGQMTSPNRFVRSATHDFMSANDGSISDRQDRLYEDLAKGEVGLIISGHAYVNPAGKASPYQISAYSDDKINGLRRLTKAAHSYDSRIILQIAHAGRQTNEKLSGETPLSPSAVYEPTFKVMPREMTEKDIHDVIDDFVQAARRAQKAGFDGVQLHIAHGYLLSSFLSPYTNRRTDVWGGPLTNRIRITQNIIKSIKKTCGTDYPLIAKINATDLMDSGLMPEECVQAAVILEKNGMDGFEISGGMAEAGQGSVWKGVRAEEDEGYFVPYAALVKQEVSVPVIGLGGIRTFKNMELFIQNDQADMVSLSRPFIREPFLVHKFRERIINKSECLSCNKCFNPRGIQCALLEKIKSQRT